MGLGVLFNGTKFGGKAKVKVKYPLVINSAGEIELSPAWTTYQPPSNAQEFLIENNLRVHKTLNVEGPTLIEEPSTRTSAINWVSYQIKNNEQFTVTSKSGTTDASGQITLTDTAYNVQVTGGIGNTLIAALTGDGVYTILKLETNNLVTRYANNAVTLTYIKYTPIQDDPIPTPAKTKQENNK